jgi:hypothetical protein
VSASDPVQKVIGRLEVGHFEPRHNLTETCVDYPAAARSLGPSIAIAALNENLHDEMEGVVSWSQERLCDVLDRLDGSSLWGLYGLVEDPLASSTREEDQP